MARAGGLPRPDGVIPMDMFEIKGKLRTEFGTSASRRLRAAGEIPAILYGGGQPVLHASLPLEAVDRLLRAHTRLVSLDFQGDRREAGLLREVQVDPVTDQVLHLDFTLVDVDKPVEVTVPLEFLGHPKGLAGGGKLVELVSDLPIKCLPGRIPQKLSVPVAGLDLGEQIAAGQVALPPGVTLEVPPDTIVCVLKAFAEAPAEEAAPVEPGPSEPEVIRRKPTEGEEEGQ